MKIRGGFLVLAGALACWWSMGSNPARADQVLYSGVGFMQGNQTLTDSLTLSSSGTLTVSLANIGWPQPLSSLTLLLTSAGGAVLGQESVPGVGPFSVDTETFNVQAGNITAQWFGTAQGSLNSGVYGLEIQFQPGAGSPVPLPTSIALLLSGLGLLIWQRRTRSDQPYHELGPDVQAT